ncbi:MAG TPA: DUF6443 domain-containing protein [Bacteroidales bacterium]|nr:DUF6443 domain-containing protein [Bacteroidales bacterium]
MVILLLQQLLSLTSFSFGQESCIGGVNAGTYNFTVTGGSESFTVYRNNSECTDYSAWANDSWLNVSTNYSNSTVYISAPANTGPARSTTINVVDYPTGNYWYVSVSQACGSPSNPTSAISDRNYLCPNEGNITLTASGGSGTTLRWLSGGCTGTSVGTGNPLTIAAPATTTTYYARWENNCGNSSCVSVTVTVRGVPSPVAYNDGPICEDSNLSLHANGGSSYSWTGPSGFSSSIADPIIEYASTSNAGTYYVTVSNGYCSAQASTTVTIHPIPHPTVTTNSPVCAGSTISLSTGAASSYSWSGPNNFTSSAQNPSIPNAASVNQGGYTVLVTNSYGCSNTGWGSVVLLLPVMPRSVTSNRNDFCSNEGGTITLTATGGSGTTLRWLSGSCTGTTVGTVNPLTIPAPTTTTTYYARWENCSGYSSCVSVTVNVRTAPSAIAYNNGPICENSDLLLHANGGYSYSWTGPNGFSSSVADPVIEYASSSYEGTYFATVSNGYCSAQVSTTVTIHPIPHPTVTTNSPVCIGSTINISTGSASSYLWTDPNGYTSTAQNILITNAKSSDQGGYTVVVTNSFGCSNTGWGSVNVNPLPTAIASSNGPICYEADLHLLCSGSGGDRYSWTGPNFNSSLQNPVIIKATTWASGPYEVTVTNSTTGCSASSSTNVTVRDPFSGGTIAPASQALCYGGDAALINSIFPAGNGTGSYSYSWEKSEDGDVSWQNVGGTLTQYDPGILYRTTDYRRRAIDQNNGCASYSNRVIINVDPQLEAGTITGDETLCYGGNAGIISGSPATGGSTEYTYTWESSENNGTDWQSFPMTGIELSPGSLYTKTLFRRKVTDSRCLDSKYTPGSVTKDVAARIYPGLISEDKAIFYNTNTLLTSKEDATGGTGVLSYQWQLLKEGDMIWSDIPGATSAVYNTSNLIKTTRYHRNTIDASNNCLSTSNDVKITINVFGLPSDDKNYIYVREPKTGVDNLDKIVSPDEYSSSVQYFDGLGRPWQDIRILATPVYSDLVTPYYYDSFGRDTIKYLPFSVPQNRGKFVDNAITKQEEFYDNDLYFPDEPANDKIIYERSPLNRITEESAPGTAWQVIKDERGNSTRNGHTVRYEYGTNANDIYLWRCDEVNHIPRAIAPNTKYSVNSLYRVRTYDENADIAANTRWTEEYKDKQGNVILRRAFDGTNNVNTYYIYDDFGLLRYVLPPAVMITSDNNDFIVTASEIDKYCYVYNYDSRKRMISKKLPGAAAVYMVYDGRDRLVATQDGNHRDPDNDPSTPGKWLFTKYDRFNRPVMTGLFTPAETSQSQLQSAIYTYYNTSGVQFYSDRNINEPSGYTLSQSYPNGITESDLLTITYYDDYVFPGKTNFTAETELGVTEFNTQVKGQVTGGKTRNLSNNAWLSSTIYYDDKYRTIQSIRSNHLNGSDMVTNKVDFTGRIIKSQSNHTGSAAVYTTRTFDYDHAGRLTKIWHSVNGNPAVLMSYMKYNELGQLVDKKIHSTDEQNVKFLQSVDYKYNIRGWLTHINKPDLGVTPTVDDIVNEKQDVFGMEIKYNDPFNN